MGRGAEILEGGIIFWQVADGGHLFLAQKILKKPAEPIFPRVSGKNKTKKFLWKNIFPGGGHLFLAASNIKISGPLLPIENEPSLMTGNI